MVFGETQPNSVFLGHLAGLREVVVVRNEFLDEVVHRDVRGGLLTFHLGEDRREEKVQS